MKNVKLMSYNKYLFIALAFLFGITACKDDDEPVLSNPSINIEGDEVIAVKKGEPINVTFNLAAEGGNKELLVYQNNGLLEVVPLSKEAASYTYSGQSVPADATEGEEYEFEFSLVNTQNAESPKVKLIVSTLAYDEIQIGETTLYEVAIPEDGFIDTNYKFVSGRNYYINSSMSFQEGSSLTIEEGVKLYVKADAEFLVDITINDGAEIHLTGTSSNPVVITSENELTEKESTPGDWGIFNIKGSGEGSNSGTVAYLRLEYGTARNFRLQNVGSGTEISHVQVYRAAGEGVMITDGDVNIKYIVTTDCEGGGFRLGDDYKGNMQFGIAQISETFADNTEVEIRETASPTLANFTVIGPGEEADNTIGMRLRSASSGKIYNTIIASFPRRGLRLNDDIVITDLDGPTVFAYSYIFDVPKDPYRDDTNYDNPFQGYLDEEDNFHNPFFNNVTGIESGDPVLSRIAGIATNNFIPDAAQGSEFDATSLGSFFSSAPFVGAIKDVSNDWTQGWVKNADGTIR